MHLIVAFHRLPTIASLTSARNFVSRDAGTILLEIARVMFVLIRFVKRRNLPREAAGLRIPGLVRCALVRVEAVGMSCFICQCEHMRARGLSVGMAHHEDFRHAAML